MDECVGGCMNGCMCGCMCWWMDVYMYVCMNGVCVCVWIDGCVCVGVCVYIWMGEWIELPALSAT